jgi:hypothetical protein
MPNAPIIPDWRAKLRAFPAVAIAGGEPPRLELVEQCVAELRQLYPSLCRPTHGVANLARIMRRRRIAVQLPPKGIGVLGMAMPILGFSVVIVSGMVRDGFLRALVLAHEFGHIALEHLRTVDELEAYRAGGGNDAAWITPARNARDESEANLFAAKLTGITYDECADLIGAEIMRVAALR